ncbi:MAG: N-acetyl-gamma-glutamyl-phosphate reductase [Pseudomonadota bacterium]
MAHPIAILGASGYTGAELIRFISGHPELEIRALTADRKAGQPMGAVFPHLAHLDLPPLERIEDLDLSAFDLVFTALPHGVTQDLAKTLPKDLKLVDLSADFRLRDGSAYEKWYGAPHKALDLQPEAAYGLPEIYRDSIAAARITANTGCHVVTGLLPLIPLLEAGSVATDGIIIDTKTGVSGAGRALREGSLFSEVNDGVAAYGLAHHRHMGEFDQELSRAAGERVTASFTPHLIPMDRGLMATIYGSGDAETAHAVLSNRYGDEPFVQVLPLGEVPSVKSVRGSNLCRIGVVADRTPGRVILVSVTDNLVKGASGQAVQNANVMLGLEETMCLSLVPVFP